MNDTEAEITQEDIDNVLNMLINSSPRSCQCGRGMAMYELHGGEPGTVYDLMCKRCVDEITDGHRLTQINREF